MNHIFTTYPGWSLFFMFLLIGAIIDRGSQLFLRRKRNKLFDEIDEPATIKKAKKYLEDRGYQVKLKFPR